MYKFKPWLLLILVFLAGLVCGVVGTRQVMRHMVFLALRSPDRMRDRMERRLTSDLTLTPEQRVKAHTILLSTYAQLQQLRTELGPRYLAIVDQAQSELSTMLTPEQRVTFEKLVKKRRFLWRPAEITTQKSN